jgi:hypothetical protein
MPSLPRTPSRLRRAPQRFCQSELECRHAHSLWVDVGCTVADGWGALVLSIGKARLIVVTEPIQLGSDFTRLRDLPPNIPTNSYYFRHSNKHAQTKPNSLGHRFSGTAFGWSSFLTFVSRRSLQLRSAPTVNPACAALRGAYPKTAPCSLPRPFGSAPLRRLTAPPCAPSLANYETNVFYWPAKARILNHKRSEIP